MRLNGINQIQVRKTQTQNKVGFGNRQEEQLGQQVDNQARTFAANNYINRDIGITSINSIADLALIQRQHQQKLEAKLALNKGIIPDFLTEDPEFRNDVQAYKAAAEISQPERKKCNIPVIGSVVNFMTKPIGRGVNKPVEPTPEVIGAVRMISGLPYADSQNVALSLVSEKVNRGKQSDLNPDTIQAIAEASQEVVDLGIKTQQIVPALVKQKAEQRGKVAPVTIATDQLQQLVLGAQDDNIKLPD